MTNREFARKDETFQKTCKEANCKATGRQASKWINGKGIAWKVLMKKAKPLTLDQGGYYEY